jgi:hypothetical protein
VPGGAKPGTPPAEDCNGAVPMITESGRYVFNFTGARADYNLDCSSHYPNRRDLVFGIKIGTRKSVGVTLAQSGPTSSAIALTADCALPTSGIACGATEATLDPGTYYVIMETYSDAAAALDVTITSPPELQTGVTCMDADALATEQCPLSVGNYGPGKLTGGGLQPAPAACASGTLNTSVAPFRLAQRRQVTVGRSTDPFSRSSGPVGGVALRTPCGVGTSDLNCLSSGGVFTTALDPGIYYLVTSSGALDDPRFPLAPLEVSPTFELSVEPIPPAATNISCSSRLALQTPYDEPRIVGGPVDPKDPGRRLRFYSLNLEGDFDVMVSPGGSSGCTAVSGAGSNFSWSLRGDCADETTEFMAASYIANVGRAEGAGRGLPAGTYSLIISATEGSKYSIVRQ